MSPPLISDYKKSFTVKRLCQTFLGGLRLFGIPYVYIIVQLVLFTFPAIILSVVNFATDNWSVCWKAIVIGLSVLLVDFSLNLGLSYLKRAKRVGASPIFSRRGSTFLAEEDRVEYEGFFDRSTWVFVAPNATVDDSLIIVGVLTSALAITLCSPLVILERTGNILLRTLGVFTLCNQRYSAVISLPPEISTFDPIRQKNILFRPFYASLLGLGYVTAELSNGDPNCGFWFLLGLSVLPLLWGLGIFPPLDAIFPWLAEIVLKIMGGSPTYFYAGNFLALLIALLCPVIVFISRLDNVLIILIQCSLGYAISCDIGVLLRLKGFSNEGRRQKARTNIINFLKPLLSVLGSLMFASIPMIIVIPLIPPKQIEIILLITSITIAQISYLFGQFLIGNVTKVWNKVHFVHAIIAQSLTFILQFWIAVEISSETAEGLSLKHLLTQILTIRAFAQSITHPRLSSLDMSVVAFLQIMESNGQFEFVVLLFFVSIIRERLHVFLRHFSFIGIVIYSTVQTVLLGSVCQMCGAILLLLPYSLSSLIISSLVDGSTLSSLFTLPIFLTGFPRPNSFWKGSWFPKAPINLQGTKKNLDWILYSDIATSLTTTLVKSFCRAHLKIEPGNCYVARYEDRLIFIRILSSGWNFAYLQVKGLEMQEQTSCHHQEAAAMDELFEKCFGTDRNSCLSPKCSRTPNILHPLMTVRVSTFSESKATILNLKSKEERAVFQKMFFKTFSFLWMKSNPLFHGIDAYRKSVCSGYNLHSTENSSLASTPLSDIRHNNFSFDYGVSPREKFAKELMMNHPNSIDEMNTRNTFDSGKRKSKKSFGNELPVWNLSHLPTLPGMEFRPGNNDANGNGRNFQTERPGERDKNLITNTWISKCLGDLIMAQGAKDKVEELCWEIWGLVFAEIIDFAQVDLQRFFSEIFVSEVLQIMKLDGLSLADISIQAFRYASKLALDEIYNSFEPISEEDIFAELTYFEEHCIRFCTPSEIGTFLQQKDERIISMVKGDDGVTQLKIYNYETGGVEFRIGKMSRSCVEGIWANLNMELLYLTSDDDERFSIQNDKYLMRNITTQCANSPLGYPVFDAIFRVNLFNFNIDQM